MTFTRVGDIVVIWNTGDRRLIIDRRDEIVPCEMHNNLVLKTVFRLAGNEYKHRWFDNSEISSVIPRNTL
jgi:hypothetical protein